MRTKLLIIPILLLLSSTAFADSATFRIGDFPEEDAYGSTGITDSNGFDNSSGWQFFGYSGSNIYNAYWRWALTIPKGSTITSAHVRIRSDYSNAGVLNIAFAALSTDNKWEAIGGFNRTNYPNGTALDSIPRQGTPVPWENIGNWVNGVWYEGPDIANLVQARIDNDDYDPLDIEDKYFGLVLYYLDGSAYRTATQEPDDNSFTTELLVDWTPGINPPSGVDSATFVIDNADQEDAFASIGLSDANGFDNYNGWQYFGYASSTACYYNAYWKWPLTIPKGVTVTKARVRIRSDYSNSGQLNAALDALRPDRKWETVNGFNRTNYPNGTALNAIPLQGTEVPWDNIANWVNGTWYEAPDITNLVQARIDNDDYNPEDMEERYFGLRLGYVSGSGYRTGTQEPDADSFTAKLYVKWELPVQANACPTANAGPDNVAGVCETAQLDGSLSEDPDGDPLMYAWSFVSKPLGSTATLSDSTDVSPTFTTDLPGDYVVELVVDDGECVSEPVTCTVSASASTDPCPKGLGFWKNHPDAWPIDTLVIGSETYSKDELQAILQMPTRGDASIMLARELIVVQLNLICGCDPEPVQTTILSAYGQLSAFSGKLPYKVKTSASQGKAMIEDASLLDSYSNGWLTDDCAP